MVVSQAVIAMVCLMIFAESTRVTHLVQEVEVRSLVGGVARLPWIGRQLLAPDRRAAAAQ